MNVKIDSSQIKAIQQSLLELQKTKIADSKEIFQDIRSDVKKISKDSINLKNIDPENSTISYSHDQINFNLVFNAFTQIQLNANGSIRREEKSIEIYFKYLFQREVSEDSKAGIKDFMLSLKMKAYFEETISVERKFEKEDILKFIQRLVNEIFDTLNDGSKSLRAVLIDEDDFKEITKAGVGDLKRLLQSLLGTVFSFIKHKELSNKNNLKVGVILNTKREKHEVKEYTISKLESFSIEIQQLDAGKKNNQSLR
ncbi:MAG: hypothetical protein NTX65_13350 [Ignavibacteriales bacterium]|nr:hypothetical protein [Ignavibacteriales bacterium]